MSNIGLTEVYPKVSNLGVTEFFSKNICGKTLQLYIFD